VQETWGAATMMDKREIVLYEIRYVPGDKPRAERGGSRWATMAIFLFYSVQAK